MIHTLETDPGKERDMQGKKIKELKPTQWERPILASTARAAQCSVLRKDAHHEERHMCTGFKRHVCFTHKVKAKSHNFRHPERDSAMEHGEESGIPTAP